MFYRKEKLEEDISMKKKLIFGVIFVLLLSNYSYASFLDSVKDTLNTKVTKSTDGKIDLGLKEALNVGIKKTIKFLNHKINLKKSYYTISIEIKHEF